jgi:hypothetical protein
LNGEEKVQAAKTAAIQELGTYSNLNHAQSNTAQDRIWSLSRILCAFVTASVYACCLSVSASVYLTQSQVEQALANVNQAQQDLNGEEKVQAAKTAAIHLDSDQYFVVIGPWHDLNLVRFV